MNANAVKSVAAYDAQANKLCVAYNSLNTPDVLSGIDRILPMKPARRAPVALDLGCGSGRDAFWLASRGFRVIGADASMEMIRNAWDKNLYAGRVTYVEDQIPDLRRVKQMALGFDFYLMSAVWMHLDTKERERTIAFMDDRAYPNATAYISLRHGPSPADRPMFDTSVEEVQDLAAQHGAKTAVLDTRPDHLGRGDVTWDYVAIQFNPTKPHPGF